MKVVNNELQWLYVVCVLIHAKSYVKGESGRSDNENINIFVMLQLLCCIKLLLQSEKKKNNLTLQTCRLFMWQM